MDKDKTNRNGSLNQEDDEAIGPIESRIKKVQALLDAQESINEMIDAAETPEDFAEITARFREVGEEMKKLGIEPGKRMGDPGIMPKKKKGKKGKKGRKAPPPTFGRKVKNVAKRAVKKGGRWVRKNPEMAAAYAFVAGLIIGEASGRNS